MAGLLRPVGAWFAVPLSDGGYASCLVVRGNSPIFVGYFFGPRREEVPSLEDLVDLRPDDAVYVSRFGYLGIRDGRWPILGRSLDWSRDDWPMPVFIRYEELTGRTFAVYYDENAVGTAPPREVLLTDPFVSGPVDAMAGAESVEIRLSSLLP